MDDLTDEQLVSKIQTGDVLAFETIVKRYQGRLWRLVQRISRDDATSEEVVQDALFSFYRTIDRFDTRKKVSGYLFTIARNAAISRLRQAKKQVSLEEIELAEEDETLYKQLVQSEEKRKVARALRHLPEKYRSIIRLYFFSELSYGEISRKLKLPLNTVRTNLRRAKEALRKLLV